MSEHKRTPLQIQAFARHLLLEEKSAATMEKYLRDIRAFACWLGDREICKELTAEWKAYLAEQGGAARPFMEEYLHRGTLLLNVHRATPPAPRREPAP